LRALGAGLVLVLAVATGLPVTYAAFSTVRTDTSAPTAAAAFPTTRQRAVADGVSIEHRLDEAPSAAATSVLADTAGTAQPGIAAGASNGPSLRWDLDDGAGTVAADRSGAVNPGTLGAGAAWTTPARERTSTLQLNGSATGYAAARGPAVDSSRGFTVSAWVYLTGSTIPSTATWVATQSGSQVSGFGLSIDATGHWNWSMPRSDVSAPVWDYVQGSTATTQAWTHLVGVFDPAASGAQLKLYVDNAAPVSAARTSSWAATGAFQLGRLLYGGGWREFLPGRIAEVRTYRRALGGAEVAALYSDTPKGVYQLQENGGSTTRDGSGNGNTVTLAAGATWTPAGHNGPAVSFDGSGTGYAAGSTAAVATNTSFSVAAWVYPTGAGGNRTAISQAGTQTSGFALRIANNRWAFTVPPADAANVAGDTVAGAATPAAHAWTHLAGVYNSAAGTITLYVNGVSQGSIAHSSGWNATGRLQLGRGLFNAAPADPWLGRIDEVRLYQRALTAGEVGAALGGAPLTAGLPGALQGRQQGLSSTTALALNGTTGLYNDTAATNPLPVSVECWFKAVGTAGGSIVGFQASRTGLQTENTDRVLSINGQGRLSWLVSPGTARTVTTTAAYNDGGWHHVVASVGPAGMRLHVDGFLAAADASVTSAQNFTGYWRWGGTSIAGFFTGSLDELAVYPTQLSDQQISWHYHADH
jgi:Concanavalin A-like lectin/glucanases superfamily